MKQTSKEKILDNIKLALKNKAIKPQLEKTAPDNLIFPPFNDSLEITFARELQKVDGKFVFCIDKNDLIQNLQQIVEEEKWESVYCTDDGINKILLDAEIPFTKFPEDFHQMQVAATGCEYLIARFGSIMVSSGQISGRQLNVFPPTHIIIAKTSQLVPEISDALLQIQQKYKNNLPSMITLITGPSRTADIEKTLILGAHGPKELYVFLIDDSKN
ncbi:MAG: hypothetical protein GXO79_13775 [Chlorobi bacterium]|nr:hypothetical protein [Chlorobiota bacterium]